MIKQATVMYMLQKRADNNVVDSIKKWWEGLDEDTKKGIMWAGGGALAGSLVSGASGAGLGKSLLIGGLTGAGAYAGRKYAYPWLMNLFTRDNANSQNTVPDSTGTN